MSRLAALVVLVATAAACGPSTTDLGGPQRARLIAAARAGDVDTIARLAASGIDLDAPDPGRIHWTPLQHAAHKRQPAAVRVLLEWGAQPDARTPANPTALFMAADDVDPTIVTLLLDAGADPTTPGPGNRTPLSQAVSGGALWDIADRPLLGGCHTETVRALVRADPSAPARRPKALSAAIWWARVHDCEEVLKLAGTWTGHTTADKIVTFGGFMKDTFEIPSPKDVRARRHATRAQSQP